MGTTFAILKLVLELPDSNWVALVGRLICTGAHRHLCLPHHSKVRLSLPLPPSALDAAWQPHVQRALHQLSERVKCELLPTAASSGSETNMELAWGLLRPSLFPELLPSHDTNADSSYYASFWGGCMLKDPGQAAIAAGHAHLLPWLVRNRCPLYLEGVLGAAAAHLDLEGVHWAMQLLGGGPEPPGEQWICRWMATAAARSGDAAIPKLAWLLSANEDDGMQEEQQKQKQPQSEWERRRREEEQRRLLCEAALGAAEGGSLSVLQWLHGQRPDQQVLDLDQWSEVLSAALRHGHLHVADWVVDQEGLPRMWQWRKLSCDACSSGSMEPVRWLLRREVPVHGAAIEDAARAGNLEAVQLVCERFRTPLTVEVFCDAASSGSVPTATWLLQAGCPMGPRAYYIAAGKGSADMVVWLAREARCPWDDSTLAAVISRWPYFSNGALLPAVRALVEAGCPHGDGTEAGSSTWHAAARGDLPLLRYLHEELGLGFGPGMMEAAAKGGCEALLEWLMGAGCKLGSGYPYARAAAYGDLATLSCLHRLAVPFSDESWWREADKGGRTPLAACKWMVERGAQWCEEGAKKLVESGRVHVDEESLSWYKARVA